MTFEEYVAAASPEFGLVEVLVKHPTKGETLVKAFHEIDARMQAAVVLGLDYKEMNETTLFFRKSAIGGNRA